MPVVQGVPADARHVVQPALRLADVFVVAGDVDAGEPGPHGRERSRLLLAHLGGAVGDVAEVADDVGVEVVDAVHDRRRPPRPIDRPVVGVGDDHHAQAVEPAAESGDVDVDVLWCVAPASPRRNPTPAARPRRRRRPRRPCATSPGRRRRATNRPRRSSCAEHRPDEQHPDRAEQHVTGDGGPILVSATVSHDHRRGQPDEDRGEHQRADHHHGRGPLRARRQQRPPRHPEQYQQNAEYGNQQKPSAP